MKRYWYTILFIFSLSISAAIPIMPAFIPNALAKAMNQAAGYSLQLGKHITVSLTGSDEHNYIQADGNQMPETTKENTALSVSNEKAPESKEASPAHITNNPQASIPNSTVSGEMPESSNGARDTSDYSIAIIPDFTDVLFIGDSRTVGLSEYGDLRNAEVFANSGMSVFNLFDTKVRGKDGSKKSLEQVLAQKQFHTIYLMLGINELGYGSHQTVVQYQSVVDAIKLRQPDAAIVLEANLHVTQEKSAQSPIYNNENIDFLNNEIKKIAENNACYYIDVNEIFDDETGSLNASYSTDGSHILGKYYSVWVEWLRGM